MSPPRSTSDPIRRADLKCGPTSADGPRPAEWRDADRHVRLEQVLDCPPQCVELVPDEREDVGDMEPAASGTSTTPVNVHTTRTRVAGTVRHGSAPCGRRGTPPQISAHVPDARGRNGRFRPGLNPLAARPCGLETSGPTRLSDVADVELGREAFDRRAVARGVRAPDGADRRSTSTTSNASLSLPTSSVTTTPATEAWERCAPRVPRRPATASEPPVRVLARLRPPAARRDGPRQRVAGPGRTARRGRRPDVRGAGLPARPGLPRAPWRRAMRRRRSSWPGRSSTSPGGAAIVDSWRSGCSAAVRHPWRSGRSPPACGCSTR